MRRRAFTLIELLVVVGILAVLISILLPTLSGARQHANAIKCASNLRQIATGWQMYIDNNKGCVAPGRPPEFPPPSTNLYHVGNGDFYRPRWFALMGAYAGMSPYNSPSAARDDRDTARIDNEVFLCPEVPDRNNNRNYCFGYNFQFLGNQRFKTIGDPKSGYIHFPVKAARIKAAETVMAADSMGSAAGKPESARTAYHEDGANDMNARGNHGWALDPPRLTDRSDYCDQTRRQPEHRSGPDPRHRGKANVAFCDGHVERMTLQDMGYVVNDDESVVAMGGGAHNRMFAGTGRDDDPPAAQ